MRKKIGIKIVVGVTVFSAAFAMAATLGGISSGSLGADDAVVASCDSNGVTSSYTTAWDATDKRYEVTGVTVGGVSDTCDGLTLKVTLTDSTGASIGDGLLALPSSLATSHSVTLTTAPSAKAIVGINITIA